MKSILTFIGAASVMALPASATVTELFGSTVTDLSGFDTIKDDGGEGFAVVSVQSGKLSFNDQSGSTSAGASGPDKPEGYYGFANTTAGLRLDFDVQFNNASISTLVSDPEIRLRLGNNGVQPTSDAKTGFAMIFRNEDTDGTNQVRAGQWNGVDKISSTSSGLGSYADVGDNTELSFSLVINNAFVAQTYNAGANEVAANTYDLFIDSGFIGNYALGEDTSDFDRDLGFGTIGFLGSSDADQGVDMWFDNIILSTEGDNGLTPVPEPSVAVLLSVGLLGLTRRKRRN